MRVFSLTLLLCCALAALPSSGRLSPAGTARAKTTAGESAAPSPTTEPSYNANPGRAGMPRRVVTVSLFNDVSAPVRPERIAALMSEVIAEYERELNIEFEVIESLPYKGDLALFPVDQAFLLQRLRARGEIRVIFTNRTGREDEAYMTDKQSENTLAGSSHPYFGHAVIYNTEARANKRDAAGHPALVTALKHEIAHLFGVEHCHDTRSFMYTPSSRSQGEWTDDVIEQINRQRARHWFPNA